jgi:hypothetical protein
MEITEKDFFDENNLARRAYYFYLPNLNANEKIALSQKINDYEGVKLLFIIILIIFF